MAGSTVVATTGRAAMTATTTAGSAIVPASAAATTAVSPAIAAAVTTAISTTIVGMGNLQGGERMHVGGQWSCCEHHRHGCGGGQRCELANHQRHFGSPQY
jgi:hypothetical protein